MNRIIQEDIQRIVSAPLPWEEFAGSTVLVTGGAGFLPAYMVETLMYLNKEVLSNKCRVTVMVRDAKRAKERFRDYVHDSYFDIWHDDVSCIRTSNLYTDYIIHAASPANPKAYFANPTGCIAPNVLGTRMLLNGAYGSCKSFLYFSSGEAEKHIDPLDHRACYAESKRMGETMCAAWHRQFQVPAKIVRISHTYGPGMRLDDGRVFADFTKGILEGRSIFVKSDGHAFRPFLYLSEATVAFFTVLLKGECAKAYNVANPVQYMSINELAHRLSKKFVIPVERYMLNYDKVGPIPDAPPDIDDTCELGWIPTITVEEGFERTVESYRELKIANVDYEQSARQER